MFGGSKICVYIHARCMLHLSLHNMWLPGGGSNLLVVTEKRNFQSEVCSTMQNGTVSKSK